VTEMSRPCRFVVTGVGTVGGGVGDNAEAVSRIVHGLAAVCGGNAVVPN